jgi:hypothetical protein
MVKNQFNCTIKHVRTDNGQEFLSNNIQIFFTTMAFFMSAHVWIRLNKMALLNVNIATFLMWPGVYVFKPIFPFPFGVNAFSQPLI